MSTAILTENDAQENPLLLDLFSTSQDTEKKCINNAPYICIPGENKTARLYQGCCNSWTCPRCGEKRAKYEYGRMVEGARELAKKTALYMLTITCRGDITVEESEEGYLEWTNKLHTNLRDYASYFQLTKPEYAAVVERQPNRGHLHTHYMITLAPLDAFFITDEYERYCQNVFMLNRSIPEEMRYSPDKLDDIDNRQMFSVWLSLSVVSAGLGVQVRLAVVDLVEGASRYIAKYLFKEMQFTKFPEGMKRIRYSHGWPKLPEFEATSAFVVLSHSDWMKIAHMGVEVECWGRDVYERALNHAAMNAFYLDKDGNKKGGSERQP
jgi:hypothetical protein